MPKGIYLHKPMTEETKRKISKANIGKTAWHKGKHNIFSKETIAKRIIGLKKAHKEGKFIITKICKICKKEFKAQAPQKLCFECHPIYWKNNAKEYKIKHRKRYNELQKGYYHNDIKNNREISLNRCHKYLDGWEGFIPKVSQCQICGKDIFFNNKNIKTAIHFDHRNEKANLINSPTTWLQGHKRNEENEKLWLSWDFGYLCKRCNSFLPSKNREIFVMQILRYVFNLSNRDLLTIPIWDEILKKIKGE